MVSRPQFTEIFIDVMNHCHKAVSPQLLANTPDMYFRIMSQSGDSLSNPEDNVFKEFRVSSQTAPGKLVKPLQEIIYEANAHGDGYVCISTCGSTATYTAAFVIYEVRNKIVHDPSRHCDMAIIPMLHDGENGEMLHLFARMYVRFGY